MDSTYTRRPANGDNCFFTVDRADLDMARTEGKKVNTMLSIDGILFSEESHSYKFKGKDYISVTQAIRLAGLGDDFSMIAQDRMEYAQRRGSAVHKACHYFDEDELDMDTVHESIRGYVKAYLDFRQNRPIRVIAVEQRLVSIELGFAGTPDLICWIDGRRSVVDRKTAQHMSKSMGLQTAGYKILWNHIHPGTPIHDRYGLQLGKDGRFKLVQHEDPDDESAFMDALHDAKSELTMTKWRAKYAK